MATVEQERGLAEAPAAYDRYVTPLEAEHSGEFVAVAPDGRTFLGGSVIEVLDQLQAAVGAGTERYVFKVGPRVVGRWR